jgi:hypothetical protein
MFPPTMEETVRDPWAGKGSFVSCVTSNVTQRIGIQECGSRRRILFRPKITAEH